MDTKGKQFNTPKEQNPKIFDENELEVFEGNFLEKMKKLIDWMNKKVRIERWEENKIRQKFTKRSAQEILTDGETFYMNPCNDLTLVAYALLKKNGLSPVLVMEELRAEKSPFNHMHFALEFTNEQKKVFFGFHYIK